MRLPLARSTWLAWLAIWRLSLICLSVSLTESQPGMS